MEACRHGLCEDILVLFSSFSLQTEDRVPVSSTDTVETLVFICLPHTVLDVD
jgi:hypothetical protein